MCGGGSIDFNRASNQCIESTPKLPLAVPKRRQGPAQLLGEHGPGRPSWQVQPRRLRFPCNNRRRLGGLNQTTPTHLSIDLPPASGAPNIESVDVFSDRPPGGLRSTGWTFISRRVVVARYPGRAFPRGREGNGKGGGSSQLNTGPICVMRHASRDPRRLYTLLLPGR